MPEPPTNPEPGVYQLRVVLRGVSPLIWRRLLVRSDGTIADLHASLQLVLGWSDEHLNRFVIQGREYGVWHDGGIGFRDHPRHVRIADLGLRVRERFLYEYDFTDGWQHDVRVEQILPLEPRRYYPVCHDDDLDNVHDHYEELTHLLRWLRIEVIAGKSMPTDGPAKCFGYVQTFATKPKRRLFEVLKSQGMQMNRQVTFVTDGGEDVRDIPLYLNPQAEHLIDWFHITMRLTVMSQMIKGLRSRDNPELATRVADELEGLKWFLWHGKRLSRAADDRRSAHRP